jgi:hypothetical protein
VDSDSKKMNQVYANEEVVSVEPSVLHFFSADEFLWGYSGEQRTHHSRGFQYAIRFGGNFNGLHF